MGRGYSSGGDIECEQVRARVGREHEAWVRSPKRSPSIKAICLVYYPMKIERTP